MWTHDVNKESKAENEPLKKSHGFLDTLGTQQATPKCSFCVKCSIC
jgi:hypothetical protein